MNMVRDHRHQCAVVQSCTRIINADAAKAQRLLYQRRRKALKISTKVSCELCARPLSAAAGRTELFIRPPYDFRVVGALLTNFHLPKSTLLMLVSALAGRELMLEAYAEAIKEKYRFYSYGDCMLII